jgi:hypothetical protein
MRGPLGTRKEISLKRGSAIGVAALLAAAPLSAVYIGEALSVDSCLDAGGSYDYHVGACDHKQNHNYIAFADRHSGLMMATGIGILVAGSMAGVLVSSRLGQSRSR